jgi:4-hydroxybenzoyl-CoA thioesterase/acyl-CoA thioester hydrolase
VEHAFWRSLGSRVVIGNDEVTLSWPRVATGCEYFSPAHFEDELELAFTVAHVGERSATFEVQFRRNGERIARGKTTAVCCAMSKGTFRPVVIPDEIRRKLTRSISPAKSTAG